MKVLGWHVTFVRRNSITMLTLTSICVDMKAWSLMYVVSVQSVSVQCRIWNLINWYTQTTNSFAVVCVVKILNANVMLCDTLRSVLLSWDLVTFNLRVDLYLLLSTHSSVHDHKQLSTARIVLLASSKQHFPRVTVILKNLHLCFVQCLNVDLTFDDSGIHICKCLLWLF